MCLFFSSGERREKKWLLRTTLISLLEDESQRSLQAAVDARARARARTHTPWILISLNMERDAAAGRRHRASLEPRGWSQKGEELKRGLLVGFSPLVVRLFDSLTQILRLVHSSLEVFILKLK